MPGTHSIAADKYMDIRLQKYKKNRLLGMNQTNAALAAGYSKAVARHHNHELEKRANISDMLERAGLTDKVLALKHVELIDAKEYVEIKSPSESPSDGVVERVNVPNYPIQIKALELAYKIKNLLRDSPIIDQSQHTHLTFIREALIKSDMIEENGKFR